jgi:Rrf2 family protein
MRTLVNHGLLQSTRGVDGGYSLAKGPSDITLYDIVEAFDNPLEPRLPELDGMASQRRERILETLQNTSQAARRELQRLTLGDLMLEQDDPPEMTNSSEFSTSAPTPPARND